MTAAFRTRYDPVVVRGGLVTQNADASGQVTVTHSGTVAPTAVVVSGRNGTNDVRVVHPIAGSTTFIVQGFVRTTAANVAAGTSLTFDWIAYWL